MACPPTWRRLYTGKTNETRPATGAPAGVQTTAENGFMAESHTDRILISLAFEDLRT